MPSSLPLGLADAQITTVALKYDKTSVFLPATGKTTVADLKRGFVEAMNLNNRSLADIQLHDAGACDASTNRPAVLAPDAFAIFQPRPSDPSGMPSWQPLNDPNRSLADLKLNDADTLAVGFKNSNGSYDLPVVEIWREDEQKE
ncbi:hypothetical protein VP01_527g4 [Puccinia sorghi]|uniref:Uncharacterized protein n=1 Tax=Puccinia sorghi TaxID=27349 RepID=A0A0L6UKD1_9BASI|nr:hypothetical protein VP01_527g4 [Puccinia sorghi]